MDYKITMFKVEEFVLFLAHSRAKISSLSNLKNKYLYFFNGRFLFYGKKLSLEFMKTITIGETLVLTFQKNMK